MALSQVPANMLAEVPSGAEPVDAIPAPGGGYWVLGSDGGIFAVGGAAYFGSYLDDRYIDPIHRNDPTRSFTNILETGTGYAIVSNYDQVYNFYNPNPPAGGPGSPTDTTPPPGTVADPEKDRTSARAVLQSMLSPFGLEGLADTVLTRFMDLGGTDAAADVVMLELRENPIYKAKFPGMEARKKAGLAPISEKEYMDWVTTYKRLMTDAGLPADFYDKDDDFTTFIGGGVSPVELKNRIDGGVRAMAQAPNEVRMAMHDMYGVSDGELLAFFLDPKVGEDVILNRVARAQIGGAAKIQGFGSLTESEAARLQSMGVDFGRAAERFGALGQQAELMGALPGDSGESISREQQLGAVGGDQAADAAIKTQARRRKARFEGGGGYASGQGGISGLGEA